MIRVERGSACVDIRLDRPEKRNALSLALLAEMRDALSPESLQGASSVVISGAGGTFSAGADLADLTGTSADVAVDESVAAVVAAIQESDIVAIAWVDGPCIGAAVDIMLACDVRIASERAWFQVPANRLALLYNPVAVARMHAMLPRATLMRLLAAGERFDAGQALAAGLVTHASRSGGGGGLDDGSAAPAPAHGAEAVAATRELLDELDRGEFDARKWQRRRLELLDSPERAAAVAAARDRSGG